MTCGIAIRLLAAAALCAAINASTALAQAPLPVGEGSQRIADAMPGDIRILVTDGLRGPMDKVRGDIEKSLGRKLVIQYSEAHVLQKEMDGGQAFELALVTQDVTDAEIAKGNMLPDKSIVARIRVGIFQRGDGPVADVSTEGALKKALLGAKSIRWSANAAAEPTALNLLAKLQIADTVRPRIHTTSMGQASQAVELAPGDYELQINIIGEKTRPPFVLAGEVPSSLQVPIILPSGIGAHGDIAAARKVVAYLMAPAFTPVLEASKLTR